MPLNPEKQYFRVVQSRVAIVKGQFVFEKKVIHDIIIICIILHNI